MRSGCSRPPDRPAPASNGIQIFTTEAQRHREIKFKIRNNNAKQTILSSPSPRHCDSVCCFRFSLCLCASVVKNPHQEPAVGLEPTFSALRERCPARRASPAIRQYPREESNLTFDLRRVACRRHTPRMSVNTPARSRTWACSFGGSHDVPFTTRAQEVDRGGS